MKLKRYAYWISTALVSLLYLASATMYIVNGDAVREAYPQMGYPAYLVSILIVAKIAAVVVILARFSVALSDLAYAGVFYHLLLAASAHINAGDGMYGPALLGIVMLLVSFFTQNAARNKKTPYLA